ncbi:MAG: hypothetical protein IPL33_12875 [Sphingobacteriales bacterium]|nr:hypothetical protein [Sphingobacteriales bacterium]
MLSSPLPAILLKNTPPNGSWALISCGAPKGDYKRNGMRESGSKIYAGLWYRWGDAH